MDPLSTHGMTAALRDAGLLARAVESSPAGSTQRTSALAEYERTRDRLSRPMMRVTEEIAAYTWDLARVRVLLRESVIGDD